MTEAEFKRRLAALVLERASKYIPDAQNRSYLELVASADDEVAKRWTPHVRLRSDFVFADIGTFPSLDDIRFYEPFRANFSATGSIDNEHCALLKSFTETVSYLADVGQDLVDAYNAGVPKKTKPARRRSRAKR